MTMRAQRGRLLSVLWMFVAVLAFAAMPAAAAQSSDASQGFRARFVQTRTQPGFPTPLVSHGMLTVSPGHGFTWEITRPYHYRFTMNDKGSTEVLPDGTHRTLKASDAPWLTAVQHIFAAALSGDRTQLARYFTVAVSASTTGASTTGEGSHLVLTPKPGALAKVIRRITVTEKVPGQPQRLHIDEVSGATMDVRFSPPLATPH